MVDGKTAVERAQARADLLRELESIAGRLHINETEHAALLAQRAEKVRALRNSGARIDELQEVLGVSRGRVHQILRGSRT